MYSVPARERHARLRGVVCAVLALAIGVFAVSSAAAEPAKRLVVLRGDEAAMNDELRTTVDALVLETLSARAGFSSVYASPIPFEDVELAAGCTTRDADCLQRIAATLGADWLLVREFARDAAGNRYLTLIAHDGPRALVTRRAVAELSEHPHGAPKRVVPLLIERLYPSQRGEPSASAAPGNAQAGEADAPDASTPTAPSDASSPATIVAWSAAGVSAALIGTSVAMWALSRRDLRGYESTQIRMEGDVDHALALHERSQKRARVARGLAIGGVGTAAIGVATLLWSQLRPRRDESSPMSVSVLPLRDGLALDWSLAWRGGL